MDPKSFPEIIAALNFFAPTYVDAITNRDAWLAKAAGGAAPGGTFAMRQAENWDREASKLLIETRKQWVKIR